jgi:16S rRNA processing protein RimM
VMIPFVKAIVPSVDVAAGIITITPPPGLLEELPDEPDTDEPVADPDTSEPAATPTPDGQDA